MADKTPTGGVRIVHRDKRLAGKTLVVANHKRPRPLSMEFVQPIVRQPDGSLLMRPRACSLCTRKTGRDVYHTVKTYHLRLDSEASLIVSHKVWDGIQQVPNSAGFELESEVRNPPPLVVRRDRGDGPGHHEGLEADVRDDDSNDVPRDALVLSRDI